MAKTTKSNKKQQYTTDSLPKTVAEADVVIAIDPENVPTKPKAPVSEDMVENIEKMRESTKPMNFKIRDGKNPIPSNGTVGIPSVDGNGGPVKFSLSKGGSLTPVAVDNKGNN